LPNAKDMKWKLIMRKKMTKAKKTVKIN
jgi:hypothetical protein